VIAIVHTKRNLRIPNYFTVLIPGKGVNAIHLPIDFKNLNSATHKFLGFLAQEEYAGEATSLTFSAPFINASIEGVQLTIQFFQASNSTHVYSRKVLFQLQGWDKPPGSQNSYKQITHISRTRP
jgi:hypothetical protein